MKTLSVTARCRIPLSPSKLLYGCSLVRLEEGPLVTAQLTDLGETQPEIGMPVEMVTRRLRSDGDERGMLIYGYKFRPVLTVSA